MNKKLSKVFAIVLALMLCLTMAVPAFATTGVVEDGKGVVVVKKKLNVLGNGTVPNASFKFTLEPYGTDKTGILPEGFTTEYPVNFTKGGDSTASFEIDFTEIDFPEAGTYHYKLTEETLESPFKLTTQGDNTRYIDVIVVTENNNTPMIQTVLMYKTADNKETTNKSEGFENDYETVDLTLEKIVTGNQGSHDEHFDFTVKVTVPEGFEGEYTVETTCNDELNSSTITADSSDSEGTGFHLKHDEKLTIKGLPKGSSYTITETAKEGYKTTITNADTTNGNTATGTLTEDKTVKYENNNNGNVPTGILLTIAPFVALMLIGAAGVLFVVLKKRAK